MKEVAYLRRQLAFRKPYEQHMQEQEVKRMKKEVKDTKQALRENVAVITGTTEGPRDGLMLVD